MRSDDGTAPAAPADVGAVSLSEVVRGIFTRRKRLVFFTTLLFMLLGLLVVTLVPPRYTASSQVIIENEEIPYTRTGVPGASTAPRQLSDRDVQSQVEIIRSHDLALKVLRQLDLIGTREFDPLKKGIGFLDRMLIRLGFRPDPRRQTPAQRALTVWQKRLKAYVRPKTRVIVIEFSSTSPRLAARVANAVAEAYVEQTRATQLERTTEAREWLKQQIDRLRQKVVEAERKVAAFRARAGLFRGTQAKLHNQQLSELAAQLVRVAAERSQAEARARAIRELLKKGEVEKSADVLRSPLIQRLREQQVRIRRRLAELRAIYKDNHPRVKAVRQELADLKRQIDVEARKIAEALEQQAKIAAAREAELRARMAQFKSRVSAAQQEEVKLRELEREAKAQRSLLESFLARYTDAMTRDAKQSLPSKARIIARALEPVMPSFPRKGPIMLLSTIAGLMLGLGLAFVLEIMAATGHATTMVAAANAGTAAASAALHTVPRGAPETSRTPGASDRDRPTTGVVAAASAAPASAAEGAATDAAAGAGKGSPVSPVKASQKADNASGTPGIPTAETPIAASGPGQAASATTLPPRVAMRVDVSIAARMQEWRENHDAQLIAVATLAAAVEEGARHALSAARLLADNYRVMLLDAAGPESPFNRTPGGKGLGELLAGRAHFADIVHADAHSSRLHVVASGSTGFADGSLHGATMRQLLQALRENYDIVLLHEGEPRYPLRERESLLPLADGVLLLAPEAMQGAAHSLKVALQRAGVQLLATVPLDAARPAPEQLAPASSASR